MDPVLIWSGSIVFSLLFLSAGMHKVRAPDYYRGLISRYLRVSPTFAGLAGIGTGIMELSMGVLLLIPVFRSTAAWAAFALLLGYLLLMASGLLRGLDMDCGCSGPLGGQKLSAWLLYRNLFLSAAAWSLTLPSSGRLIGVADIIIILCASTVLLMLYISFEHLLANREKLALLQS